MKTKWKNKKQEIIFGKIHLVRNHFDWFSEINLMITVNYDDKIP